MSALTALRPSCWIAAIFVLPWQAAGHDFWIQPSTFTPEVDELVQLSLRIGHAQESTPVIRDASRIDRFVIRGPDGEDQKVIGLDGRDPAGWVRTRQAGTHIVGYQSHPAAIELPAEKFESYLEMEGLEPILKERAARRETGRSGRERYVRCAKTILRAGPNHVEYKRRLGLTLELVPQGDPAVASSDPLTFLVLYAGAPCAGLQVTAVHRDLPGSRLTARSDRNGEVHLALDRAGVWRLSAVHMVRSASGTGHEWESYWASLTFLRGEQPSTPPTATQVSSDSSPEPGSAHSPRKMLEWLNRLRGSSRPPAPGP